MISLRHDLSYVLHIHPVLDLSSLVGRYFIDYIVVVRSCYAPSIVVQQQPHEDPTELDVVLILIQDRIHNVSAVDALTKADALDDLCPGSKATERHYKLKTHQEKN